MQIIKLQIYDKVLMYLSDETFKFSFQRKNTHVCLCKFRVTRMGMLETGNGHCGRLGDASPYVLVNLLNFEPCDCAPVQRQ